MFNRYTLVVCAHFLGTAVALKALAYILPESVTGYYYSAANILLFAILSWHAFKITKQHFLKDRISAHNKAVLITGCDSGFGHNLAKRLDSKGFHVFATCLSPSGEGAESLRTNCTSRLQILQLDVTSDQSVADAVTFVENHLGSAELWAIVNNAGIDQGLTFDLSTLQDFRACMEVNYFGVLRVTKAFLPLLKKSKGRVVNVTSFLGRMTISHRNPYNGSKHAAVGFCDSLRQELVDWDIKVISIEPELFQTNITSIENGDEVIRRAFSETSTEYSEEYQANLKRFQNTLLSCCSPNIRVVIDDMEAAICLEHPDDVYAPSRNDFMRFIMFIFINSPVALRDFYVKVIQTAGRLKKPSATSTK